MSPPSNERSRSKLPLVFGLLLVGAAVVLVAIWLKREADFRDKFTKMGGGPDTKVVSGGTQTFEHHMENGRWKLVKVDRGSEGEITQVFLYSGVVVGLAGVGLVALWWLGRRRSPTPSGQ